MVEEKHLLVKKSTLPAAGKGLFTKKAILAGTRIVEYKGKITTWSDVKKAEADNLYIMYVTRNHIIDAGGNKKAKARYANDALGLTRAKGIFNNSVYRRDGLRIFIEATKNIPAGGEIFVDYGKDYWDTIKYNNSLAEKNRSRSGRKKGK